MENLHDRSITVITPYYNSEQTIEPLYQEIKSALEPIGIKWSVAFIDDCSPCNGWKKIIQMGIQYNNVYGLRLSRNYGQNIAIKAGLDNFDSDYYVVMDCDLQDNPSDIPNLLNALLDSRADIVRARRQTNSDVSFSRGLARSAYILILRALSADADIENFGTYCIFNRKVNQALRKNLNKVQSFALNIACVGFNMEYISVRRRKRIVGRSGYKLSELIKLAVNSFISHSEKIVYLLFISGFVATISSVAVLITYLCIALFVGFGVSGFATLVLLVLGFGSFNTLVISLVGISCARILTESRREPLYVIQDQYSHPDDLQRS